MVVRRVMWESLRSGLCRGELVLMGSVGAVGKSVELCHMKLDTSHFSAVCVLRLLLPVKLPAACCLLRYVCLSLQLVLCLHA